MNWIKTSERMPDVKNNPYNDGVLYSDDCLMWMNSGKYKHGSVGRYSQIKLLGGSVKYSWFSDGIEYAPEQITHWCYFEGPNESH